LSRRIFITGGKGYIGSRLIPLLAEPGMEWWRWGVQARNISCRQPACRCARRLGLVTVEQMLRALAEVVERLASGVSVIEVPAIRATR